jgi:hypothetical protein
MTRFFFYQNMQKFSNSPLAEMYGYSIADGREAKN